MIFWSYWDSAFRPPSILCAAEGNRRTLQITIGLRRIRLGGCLPTQVKAQPSDTLPNFHRLDHSEILEHQVKRNA